MNPPRPESVLFGPAFSFERKLDPSDATFSAGRWDQRRAAAVWPPIILQEKRVRVTHCSNSASFRSPSTSKASLDRWTSIDTVRLPDNADTLRISFALRVIGKAGIPESCSLPRYSDRLAAIVDSYREAFGFQELATRYANNLVNARFAWRNRFTADAMEVRIRCPNAGLTAPLVADAFAYSLRQFTSDVVVDTIARHIGVTLMSESYASFEVEAFARLGTRREVFPSQELILDKGDWRTCKSKTLHSVQGAAAIHARKIGNAMRTIDTWYSGDSDLSPIAVEPYGPVLQPERSYRPHGQGKDFQSLLETWLLEGKAPDAAQQHYLMANMIRGGIVGRVAK